MGLIAPIKAISNPIKANAPAFLTRSERLEVVLRDDGSAVQSQ
jgi:hypothetical protein